MVFRWLQMNKDKIMKYKLLVLDLDGTLLNKKNIITDESKKVINKIRNKEMQVVIATGRMMVSAMKYVRELGLSTPVISYNGAYVKNPVTNKIIIHQPINLDFAEDIIKESEEKNLHLNLYQDDKLYVAEKDELSSEYARTSGVTVHPVGLLSEFISKAPTKLLIIENQREKQQFYLNYFQEKYQSELEVTESKKNFIEFTAKRVSKGRALNKVAANLGVKMKEIISFGDGGNDLEMIQKSGLGVAMKNAPDGVKKGADMIAPSNDEDGVAYILSNHFLEK